MTRPGRQSSGGGPGGLEGGGEAGPRRGVAGRGELVFEPFVSNLQISQPRVAVVARRDLVAALLRSAAPLVVVSAPAGSGKPLALVQ